MTVRVTPGELGLWKELMTAILCLICLTTATTLTLRLLLFKHTRLDTVCVWENATQPIQYVEVGLFCASILGSRKSLHFAYCCFTVHWRSEAVFTFLLWMLIRVETRRGNSKPLITVIFCILTDSRFYCEGKRRGDDMYILAQNIIQRIFLCLVWRSSRFVSRHLFLLSSEHLLL